MYGQKSKTPETRRIHFGHEARQKMVKGALRATAAIAATYGPRGGLVALERQQGLIHTKDGATVAREMVFSNRIENLGAQLIRQACLATNDAVGDGTTTTAILAHALIHYGYKALVAGYEPRKLTQGIQEGVAHVIEAVRSQSVSVDKDLLRYVAGVASNQDHEIADAMTEAALAVGKDGTILIEDGPKVGIELEFKDGMGIEAGWIQRDHFTDFERMEVHKESVLVATVAVPLSTPADVASIMEEASTLRPSDDDPPDPLLILAPRIDGDALYTLNLNNERILLSPRYRYGSGLLPVYMAVNAPGVGPRKVDHLGDIAAAAGATLVDPAAGMDHKRFEREWFGSFRNIALYRDRSVFTSYDEHQDSIAQRLRVLRVQERLCTSDYDKDQIKLRRARLSGGVCVFRISSHSEAALKEKRARVEDTLAAIQASLRSGVVPGGGISLLEALRNFPGDSDPEVALGLEILGKALREPTRRLSNPSTVQRILEGKPGLGWDAAEERIRDLRQHPAIIDPTDVVVEALRSAASVATTFLTTEVSMTKVK